MFRTALVAGVAIVAAGLGAPASAGPNDFVYNCAPGQADTGTVEFHTKTLGVENSMMDGTDSEFDFGYQISVTQYDPAKPGWTGPQLCAFTDRWEWDVDEPNVYNDMVPFKMGRGMVIHNVPRDARVHYSIFANERDTFDADDWADFNPSPTGSPRLELDVFVATGEAQTMVGAAQGFNDVDLGLVKRIQGDGHMSRDHDHFRAYLDFVVDVAIAPKVGGGLTLGTGLPDTGQPLNPNNTAVSSREDNCRAYAIRAVEQYASARAFGCPTPPPVWSPDHQMHFDWCMLPGNAKLSAQGTAFRDAALTACLKGKP